MPPLRGLDGIEGREGSSSRDAGGGGMGGGSSSGEGSGMEVDEELDALLEELFPELDVMDWDATTAAVAAPPTSVPRQGE